MSLSIGKYVKYKLNGVAPIINSLLIPNSDPPYIIYKRVSEVPNEYNRDGYDYNTTSVQVDCISHNDELSMDMAEQVRNIFECKSGSYKGVEVYTARLVKTDEEADGTVYVQSLTFEFDTN